MIEESAAGEGPRASRWPWLLAALCIWAPITLLFVLRLSGRSLDDFFITYRYAQNFSAGRGFAFNQGERVYGATEPGMVFLLALLHRVTGLGIPFLGTATTGLGLLALALIVLAQGRRVEWLLPAFLGGTLVVCSTFIWACHGAAAPVVLALLAAAAGAHRRPAVCGALAGVAVWFRPDAVLAVAVLGLMLWAGRRRFPLVFALASSAVVLSGLAMALWYFGTVVPNTLGAKQSFAAWGHHFSGRAFWAGAVPLLRRHGGELWLLTAGLGAIGQGVLLRRGGLVGRVLALYAAATALLYPLLKVPFFAWYVVPVVVAFLYGAAFAAVEGARALLGAGAERKWALALVSSLLLLPSAQSLLSRAGRWYSRAQVIPHYEGYREAGLWIKSNSSPQARVAALEVGTLAYFSERHVIDLLGLVSPGSLPYVAERDLLAAFRREPTEFLVLKPSLEGLMGPIRNERWFRRTYREAARFSSSGDESVVLFRRRRSAAA